MLSSLGSAHPLFDRESKISAHDDATAPKQDMPCCLDGSEEYAVPPQTSAPTIPNGEFLTARDAPHDPVMVSRVVSEQSLASGGNPILLSCQRE
jgi:hypothetical protein